MIRIDSPDRRCNSEAKQVKDDLIASEIESESCKVVEEANNISNISIDYRAASARYRF
jgi:hypothetical protein